MKLTAVEWLEEQMKTWGDLPRWQRDEIIQQAKEMEKQRLIDFAFNFYYDFCNKTNVPFNLISENRMNAEQYYNETFKSE